MDQAVRPLKFRPASADRHQVYRSRDAPMPTPQSYAAGRGMHAPVTGSAARHYRRGMKQLRQGRPEMAIKHLMQAVELNKSHPGLAIEAANALKSVGRLDDAESMLEVALATIHEVALIDDGKLYAGEQGWNNPIEYADIAVPDGWQVEIEIRDEGGKLPINTMEEPLLNRLLEEELDFDFGTARELSSTLLDWIDENNN